MSEKTTTKQRMAAFAATLPSLASLDIVNDWDAPAVDQWACSGASHGEKLAAQFALHVWNQFHEWECGRFDAIEAYGVWDTEHWKAFQAWVKNPFTL